MAQTRRPAFPAFSHLAVTVQDLEVSATFYREALSFEPAAGTWHGEGRRLARLMGVDGAAIDGLFMKNGAFFLELICYQSGHRGLPLPRLDDEYGFAHLGLLVPDLEETCRLVERYGGKVVDGARMEHVYGRATVSTTAFATDPDGNRLELLQHPDEDAMAGQRSWLRIEGMGWFEEEGE